MSINSILKKEGIENIRPLDTLTVNIIAKRISEKLCKKFEEHNLNESELFAAISRLQMNYAEMPEDLSGAKYSYGNNTIYFNEKYEIDELEEFAIHECIHYLQEIKDEKGNLLRLGLCDFKEGNDSGLAINEGAVQLMAAEACEKKEDKVKYYELFLATKSPDYYPLECVLVNEMMYFTGNYPLYHSTLHGDDVFKNTFSGKYGANTYKIIQKNMNSILNLESDLNVQSIKLQNANSEKRIKQINKKMEENKEKIAKIFLNTQDFIIENCFNKMFKEAKTVEDLMYFKDKIYHFKDIIGYTAEYKNYYNFYIQKMKELELKKEKIENNEYIDDSETEINSMELINTNTKAYSFIRKILIKIGILSEVNSEISWLKSKK